MISILRDRIKIGDYRIKTDSVFSYYPGKSAELDVWMIIIERETNDGVVEIQVEFDTEEERNKVLVELDKLLTIDPMNLRKEKLDEINQNNKSKV